MGYYVIKLLSGYYTLQEETTCDGKISTAGELFFKAQYMCCMLHIIEAWDNVVDLSCRKEDKQFCFKEVIWLYYLDSYNFTDYVDPSADVFFTTYYDPSPSLWEGGDQYYFLLL